MPYLWALIAGVLTFILTGSFMEPILITNTLLGLIVGLLFERRDLLK